MFATTQCGEGTASGCNLLTLAELEAAARTALTVFFTFHHAGIAGKKAVTSQGKHVALINLAEGARKTVTTGSCLTIGAATVYIYEHIKLIFACSDHEGLTNYHGMFTLGKISAQIFAVDDNFTGTVPYIDPRNSSFSSAGSYS
jgi:hypothetical protein